MMKSIQPILLCAFSGLLALSASSGANADLLVYDGFEAGGSSPTGLQYQTSPASTNGSNNNALHGQNPSTFGFDSAAWANQNGVDSTVFPRVIETGLSYADLQGNGLVATEFGSVEIFRDGLAGDDVGTSAGLKSVDRDTTISGAMPASGTFMSALLQFKAGTAGQVIAIQGVGQQFGDRPQGFGVDGDGELYLVSGGDTVLSGQTLNADTTYFVVAKFYVDGTRKMDLWLNPVDLENEGANTAVISGADSNYVQNNANFSFDTIRLTGQTAEGVTNPSIIFDEVRFGETWTDVTPFFTDVIPEPTSAALLGLAGLALLIRNRRSC